MTNKEESWWWPSAWSAPSVKNTYSKKHTPPEIRTLVRSMEIWRDSRNAKKN